MKQAPPPKFRPDLIERRREADGDRVRIVLQDPVSETYYRLSKYEYTLLKCLDGAVTVEEAVTRLSREGLHYEMPDARAVVDRANRLGLLLSPSYSSAIYQKHLRSHIERTKKLRFVSGIYFLFIPILNPDRFLEKTLPYFPRISLRWAAGVFSVLAIGAVYLAIAGYSRAQTEYLFFFNTHNLLFLWVTLGVIKCVHEFAHAYTAKYYGLRVPEMGIAFLIFFPCLYCNTTDAWQLADRRQRAAIAAAGICAEIVLAVASAYIWYFTKAGLLNSLAFYLMAISLLSTIFFNGNPLLKFDGYFILIDYLNLPNLASNSLRHVKYLFMNRFFGHAGYETPAQSFRDALIYGCYGVAAFIYRIVLAFSISIGVYYRLDKLPGVVLGLIAFSLFVIRPTVKGVSALYAQRAGLKRPRMGFIVLAVAAAAVLGPLLVPWSSGAVYPCYVTALKSQKLAVPLHTMVAEVYVKEGSEVRENDPIMKLDTSLLELKLKQKRIQKSVLQLEAELTRLDEKSMFRSEGKDIEVKQVEDEIGYLQTMLHAAADSSRAPFAGVVTNLDARLQSGYEPGEGAVVGELRSREELVAHALVPAVDIGNVSRGMAARIWLPMGEGLLLDRRIDDIRSYNETDLKNSPFSSRFGGELAVEDTGKGERDSPIDPQFDCSAVLTGAPPIPFGITGRMAIHKPPESILGRVYRGLVGAINRESFL